jgi:hypothetical protein
MAIESRMPGQESVLSNHDVRRSRNARVKKSKVDDYNHFVVTAVSKQPSASRNRVGGRDVPDHPDLCRIVRPEMSGTLRRELILVLEPRNLDGRESWASMAVDSVRGEVVVRRREEIRVDDGVRHDGRTVQYIPGRRAAVGNASGGRGGVSVLRDTTGSGFVRKKWVRV